MLVESCVCIIFIFTSLRDPVLATISATVLLPRTLSALTELSELILWLSVTAAWVLDVAAKSWSVEATTGWLAAENFRCSRAWRSCSTLPLHLRPKGFSVANFLSLWRTNWSELVCSDAIFVYTEIATWGIVGWRAHHIRKYPVRCRPRMPRRVPKVTSSMTK